MMNIKHLTFFSTALTLVLTSSVAFAQSSSTSGATKLSPENRQTLSKEFPLNYRDQNNTTAPGKSALGGMTVADTSSPSSSTKPVRSSPNNPTPPESNPNSPTPPESNPNNPTPPESNSPNSPTLPESNPNSPTLPESNPNSPTPPESNPNNPTPPRTSAPSTPTRPADTNSPK